MDKFYVSCGSFEDADAASEYYVAERADGTVVARGLLEDDAYALCAQMNAEAAS